MDFNVYVYTKTISINGSTAFEEFVFVYNTRLLPKIIINAPLFVVSWMYKTDTGFMWCKNINTMWKLQGTYDENEGSVA